MAKQLGATGVIMEYEEMFPFEGKLADVTAVNAYSKADIKKILDKCEEYEFEVIPLIQTFGESTIVVKFILPILQLIFCSLSLLIDEVVIGL